MGRHAVRALQARGHRAVALQPHALERARHGGRARGRAVHDNVTLLYFVVLDKLLCFSYLHSVRVNAQGILRHCSPLIIFIGIVY